MAGMEACRSAGRATGREKRPSLCPCRHCIMRLLRNLCRLCSEPPYHRDDGEALYIRVYCLYYLLAAPVNFIFRDRDWRLIEKNRNTGPALASGLRPRGPRIAACDQPSTETSPSASPILRDGKAGERRGHCCRLCGLGPGHSWHSWMHPRGAECGKSRARDEP